MSTNQVRAKPGTMVVFERPGKYLWWWGWWWWCFCFTSDVCFRVLKTVRNWIFKISLNTRLMWSKKMSSVFCEFKRKTESQV